MPDPDPGQPADKLSSASGESGASGEDSENEDGSTGSTRSTVLPGQGHDDWRSEDSTESTHSKNDDGEQAEGGKGPTLLPGQIALHDALDQGWSVGGKNKPADIALGGDEEESGEEEESEGSGEDEAESGEGDEEGSDEEEDASGQEDLDASHVERTSSNEDSNEDLDNESPRERGEVGNSAQPVSEKLRGKLPPIGAEDISVESFEDEGGKTDGYVEEEVVAAPAPKGDGTDALRSKRGQVVAEREGLEKLLDDLEQNQELTEEEEDKMEALRGEIEEKKKEEQKLVNALENVESRGQVVFSEKKWLGHTFSSLLTSVAKTMHTEDLHMRDWDSSHNHLDEYERQETLKWRQMWYTPRSLMVLTLTNPLRSRCIDIIENKWFDRCILVVIAFNVVIMAWDDPQNHNPKSPDKQLAQSLGYAFQLIFTFESSVKIVSMGLLVGKRTYLRDNWNCLDFFIVCTGMSDLVPTEGEDSGPAVVLRTFRLLRPLRALRAVGRLKGLRMLVELLIGCIPMLINVFGLISFIFFIFGILGVQLFGGIMRGRCYSMIDGHLEDREQLCSTEAGMYECMGEYSCLRLYTSPWFDIVSFDTIGNAMIVIFQVMLQEDWTDLQYLLWDSYSQYTWIFFVILNVVGPMFAIQLFLVVVAHRYSKAREEQTELENQAVCLYEVKVGLVCANLPGMTEKISECDVYIKVTVTDKWKKTKVVRNTISPEWSEYYVFPVGSTMTTADVLLFNWQRYGPHTLLGQVSIPVGQLDADDNNEGTDKWYELLDGEGRMMEGAVRVRTQWRRTDGEEWTPIPEVDDDDIDDEMNGEEEELTNWGWFRFVMFVAAESKLLSDTTIFVIFLNVVAMAWDNECDLIDASCVEFKLVLEQANLVFTIFFTIELLIKLVGLGPLIYFKDASNTFDMFIVVTSVVEIPATVSALYCFHLPVPDVKTCVSDTAGSGLSVLRSFRLARVMRIGKLVRAFPQIQKQLKVITKTIGAVGNLVALMLLFLLIFAILGMSMMGGVSMEMLYTTDNDGVPWMLPGAYVRIMTTDFKSVQTARIIALEVVSEEEARKHWGGNLYYAEQGVLQFDIEHWMEKKHERVYDARDVELRDFKNLREDINGTTIIGMAPRDSFDTFFFSILTVFQLLTASDIADVMYPCMRTAGMITVVYFVAIIIIGNFMLFNLFVAIIITGFSETKAMLIKEEKEMQAMRQQDQMKKAQSIARSMSRGSKKVSINDRKNLSIMSSQSASGVAGLILRVKRLLGLAPAQGMSPEELKEESGEPTLAGAVAKGSVAGSDKGSTAGSDAFEATNLSDLPFMRMCLENRYFNTLVITLIAFSCVCLGMQRPDISPEEAKFLMYAGWATSIFFIIEASWKISAYGWKRYIRKKWNRLDFFLVMTSLPDMAIDFAKEFGGAEGDILDSVKFLRTFRIFRALRPLRIISRSARLKVVMSTITKAIIPVMNTVMIAFFVFFVFGIMAVQVIGGRIGFCDDFYVHMKVNCTGVHPMTGVERTWQTRQLKYDSVFDAMLSMFVLASQDNWEMQMYAAVDATTVESGPYPNNNPVTALFFMVFMVVGSFFVIQLFVGVFVDTFQTVTTEVKQLGRNASIASATTSNSGTSVCNFEPTSVWRQPVYECVRAKSFDLTIAAFIVLNVFSMAGESYGAGGMQTDVLLTFDFVFNFVFGAEVSAKMFAFYPRDYFKSRWNKFDFIVVMVSFIGIAFDSFSTNVPLNPTVLRVLRIVRIFRILRAFRIFKAAQGLQNLVRTLIRSLDSISSLGALLLLLFFVFGVLCVSTYGDLCADSPDERILMPNGKLNRCALMDPGDLLDYHAIFSNLGRALLTLFRISTADNWSGIMSACSRSAAPRPSGLNATTAARAFIVDFLASNATDYRMLNRARRELPNCFSVDELKDLHEVVSCDYPDDFGDCPSTCGDYFIASVIFSGFLSMSNFILLNLVMAVLMQELSSAISSSNRKKTTETLSILVGVSQATAKWLKYAGDEEEKALHDNASDTSASNRKTSHTQLNITSQGAPTSPALSASAEKEPVSPLAPDRPPMSPTQPVMRPTSPPRSPIGGARGAGGRRM